MVIGTGALLHLPVLLSLSFGWKVQTTAFENLICPCATILLMVEEHKNAANSGCMSKGVH